MKTCTSPTRQTYALRKIGVPASIVPRARRGRALVNLPLLFTPNFLGMRRLVDIVVEASGRRRW
jgi:hypothetical protein